MQRQSNIELLRIILMIMVITLHFNNAEIGGALNYSCNLKLNNYLLLFFESVSICAVNCFMIISGYFLSSNKKIKISRILNILLIVFFYRVLDYIISVVLKLEPFTVKSFIGKFFPINYYAIFYLVTYIFSPFISILFDNLEKKTQTVLVCLLLLIFCLIPSFIDFGMDLSPSTHLEGLSTVTLNGNQGGYTVIQFFLCFIIGVWLKRLDQLPDMRLSLIVFFTSSLIMTFLSPKLKSVFNYCSIFCLLNAVSLFLIFIKLNFSNKVINYISKSIFSIYCIHISPVLIYFWKKIFIKEEFINNKPVHMILTLIISVFALFFVSFIIYLLINYTVGQIKKIILHKTNKELLLKEINEER